MDLKNTKMEFLVKVLDEKNVEKLEKYLKNYGNVEIDTNSNRIIIHSSAPWSEILNKIEELGEKAVLAGFGGSSAVAMINDNKNQIQGVIRFCSFASNTEEQVEGCVVDGTIDGLKPGLHGIHIHECGDITSGCESVGGHYNPRNSPHGGREDSPNFRHAGDLGNIKADDNGRAVFRFIDPIINVSELIGRSVVVTENPDDEGKGKNINSLIDGNSGKRLACGIIARSAGIYQNYKKICLCSGLTLWDERLKTQQGTNKEMKNVNNK